MIPPKTYKGPQETSTYQDLVFETTESEGGVVNNSEGQYDVVEQIEEVNTYEPILFEGGAPVTYLPGGGVKHMSPTDTLHDPA